MDLAALVISLLLSAMFTLLTIVVVAAFSILPLVLMAGLYFAALRTGTLNLPTHAGPRAVKSGLVKRTSCHACGAPKHKPSEHAFVHCDFCGALIDWDYQASLADPRSKKPAPAFAALTKKQQPVLDAALTAEDREAFEKAQLIILDAYVDACPAALSPRIGDPHYRSSFVQWNARVETIRAFDPALVASLGAQQEAMRTIEWDRTRLTDPRPVPASIFAVADAVVANQNAVLDALEAEDLLVAHPDRPTRKVAERLLASGFLSAWLPTLDTASQKELAGRLGLKTDYQEPKPLTTLPGACPHCRSELAAVEGATQMLCYSCGHLTAVSPGEVPCHGCGAPIELAADSAPTPCPHCDAVVAVMAAR